jgi:hypothetical protein
MSISDQLHNQSILENTMDMLIAEEESLFNEQDKIIVENENKLVPKNKPIVLNFQNYREERQRLNDILAFESIQKKDLKNHINIKAWQRVKNRLNMSNDELLEKCHYDMDFAKVVSMQISINASRQCTKDEETQILTCNITSSKYGINITKLNTTDFRPTKTGCIITNIELHAHNILKADCLKSFDAKITGIKNGWVFAKVVFGSGGHQDNVFEEIHTFCEWIIHYGEKNDLFIILIDTNLTAKIEEVYKKYGNIENIKIGNHVEIQQYFIDTYSEIVVSNK